MISIAFKSDCLSLYDDCTLVEPRILLILHGTASVLTSSLDEFISLGKSLWVRDRDTNILDVHYSYSSLYQKAHISSKTVKSFPRSCVKLRDSIFFACWWHPCVCQPLSCVWRFAAPWTVGNPPGFSVYCIHQARVLEFVVIPVSRGSSQPRDRTWVSHIAGRFFTVWATREAPDGILFACNFLAPVQKNLGVKLSKVILEAIV